MVRTRLGVVALPFLASCILFSDFSGLEGGGSKADGGPDARSTPEGGPSEAGPSDPCAGARFCDDFDTVAIADRWTKTFNADPGPIRIEPEVRADAPSAMRVLHLAVPARKLMGTYAYLDKSDVPAAKGSQASLAFRVFVDHHDASAAACIAGLVFANDTAAEHVVRLVVGSSGAYVEERYGGTTNTLNISEGLAIGKWQRVVMSVAVGGTIRVTIDDAKKLERAADASWAATKSYRIVLGANFMAGNAENLTGFDYRFDDVRLDGD